MMNDEKKMKVLQTAIIGATIILMCITLVLRLWAFDALAHTILCSCILLLLTITLIFDGILKDSRGIKLHIFWYVLWSIGALLKF